MATAHVASNATLQCGIVTKSAIKANTHAAIRTLMAVLNCLLCCSVSLSFGCWFIGEPNR